MNKSNSTEAPVVAVIDLEDVNCRLEICSCRPLSKAELDVIFRNWQKTRDKRLSIKGKTIQVIAHTR